MTKSVFLQLKAFGALARQFQSPKKLYFEEHPWLMRHGNSPACSVRESWTYAPQCTELANENDLRP